MTPDTERLRRWMDFSVLFWKTLSEDQKETYLADMESGGEPPAIDYNIDKNLLPAFREHAGLLIKTFRELQGLSAKDLAKLLDRTPGYISLVESGKKILNSHDMYCAMKLLGISPIKMFTFPPEI